MILRQVISQIKSAIKEVNADSRKTNKEIFSGLSTTSSLIIQRESDALKLYKIQNIFQSLKCVNIEEVSAIDPCCGIITNKKMYRTIMTLPEMYTDSAGVMIRNVTSIDSSSVIEYVTEDFLRKNAEDSFSEYDNSTYAFYRDGRIYITEPLRRINILAFFMYDISWDNLCNCNGEKSCQPFLDRKWIIPGKLEDNIIKATIQNFIPYEKKLEDTNINKKDE